MRQLCFAAVLLCVLSSVAAAGTVTLKVTIQHARGNARERDRNANVVVWLRPLDARPEAQPAAARRFEMAQRDKQFQPHVLAIPLGSNVSFPNQDPIFHNVFSLYKGERFDLGLYEAGTSRTVRFDRPGVSFIFCNIHPEMSAYIVALDTPYFAVSDARGDVRIADVPPGRYRVEAWYERAEPSKLAALAREISIPASDANLGALTVPESEKFVPEHTDKYGKPYQTDRTPY